MGAPISEVVIPVGALRFDARVAGPEDGRPVLLLHGFPQSSLSWRHQLAALGEAGYRAVAPDQRGYSRGARPDGVDQYHAAQLVEDVLGFADWCGPGPVDLVGHDWGAALSWAVAGTAPERLRSMTAVSVPHPAAFAAALATDDQRARSSYFELFRAPGGKAERLLLADGAAVLRTVLAGLDGEATEAYVELMSQPGALTAALNWYRAMQPGLVGEMGPVTTPTLYVWSTEDVAIGASAARGTASHVGGEYRFEVLEGVSHWIPEAAAERLSRLLLEFLGAH